MGAVRKIVISVLLFVALLGITIMALLDRHLKILGVKLTQVVTGHELHVGTLKLERSLHPLLLLSDVTWRNTGLTVQEYLIRATLLD